MQGSICGYVVRAGSAEPVAGVKIVGTVYIARGRREPTLCSTMSSALSGSSAVPELPASPHTGMALPVTSMTDRLGRFMLNELREGDCILQVQSPEGQTLGNATVQVYDNAVSDVTIEISGSANYQTDQSKVVGSIHGRVVRDDNRRPVASATVTVVRGAGPAPDISPVTDGGGWFTLDGLPPGEWVLRALSTGGESGEERAQVSAGSLVDIIIMIGASRRIGMPGSIHGRVVRADNGRPVENASITVVRGAGPAPDISPVTDGGGWFILDGLPPGEWVLRALGPEGESGEAGVRVYAKSVADIVIKVVGSGNRGVPESD